MDADTFIYSRLYSLQELVVGDACSNAITNCGFVFVSNLETSFGSKGLESNSDNVSIIENTVVIFIYIY